LGLELFRQHFVALVGRDGDGERNEIEATPDCLVHRLEARLMIAGDNQLELRRVLEEVLAHESRRNLVAAGERFDSAVGPAAAFFCLDSGDETRAAQAGKVCGMPIDGRCRERLDWGRAVVVAGAGRNRIEKCGFPVCTKSIEKEKRVLLCRASERVSGYTLKIC